MRTEPLARGQSIDFVYYDEEGAQCHQVVPPLTVGRYMCALRNEPSEADLATETLAQAMLRQAEFFAALVPERLRDWMETLTLGQATVLAAALLMQCTGQDPLTADIAQQWLNAQAQRHWPAKTAQILRALDSITVRLARQVGMMPRGLDGEPLHDVTATWQEYCEESRFVAALHGLRLN